MNGWYERTKRLRQWYCPRNLGIYEGIHTYLMQGGATVKEMMADQLDPAGTMPLVSETVLRKALAAMVAEHMVEERFHQGDRQTFYMAVPL